MIKGHENAKTDELQKLCTELRNGILSVVEKSGGHLASNLGVIELTVALHHCLNLPQDKLLFDVGHQCYAHKLLSGRTLYGFRDSDGVSGFCNPQESDYDAYGSGHSGSVVAAARGMCKARDLMGENYKVVTVIGDGALTAGETLEALNGLQGYKGQLLLVLNDNGMSISVGSGGFYKHLSRLTLGKGYRLTKNKWKRALNKNMLGRGTLKTLSTMKHFIKRLSGGCNMFEEMGIKYVGALDGHNVANMLKVLPDLLNCDVPVLLHVKTKKGKGYVPAEQNPEKYHGVTVGLSQSVNTMSDAVGSILCENKAVEPKLIAVTAAMADGTGIAPFMRIYPESVADVGICEQSAVSYACGAAMAGLKPLVFIYSTFMQRAFDQIQQELCAFNLPVVLCLDRAGFVGHDGQTHQGFYDIAMLRALPNMEIYAPSSVAQLRECITYALNRNAPTAIRYPNGDLSRLTSQQLLEMDNFNIITEWHEVVGGNGNTVILTIGPRMLDEAVKAVGVYGGIAEISVYNCTSVRPLDTYVLDYIAKKHIITMEEGVLDGGFGNAVTAYYAERNISAKVTCLAVTNTKISATSVDNQLSMAGLDYKSLISLDDFLSNHFAPHKDIVN